MNHRTSKSLISMLAIMMQCSSASSAEPPQLLHNPFSRPPSIVTIPERSLIRADGSLQVLDLRATMVATNDRLANVAGKILRPGDEVQGYTLLQVYEDHAVFAREKSRVTVYVNPDLKEDVD